MSDPTRHARDRGALESILRRIPGFKGYLDKEYRRDSDHLTRTWMTDRLEASKRGLDDTMRSEVDRGRLDSMAECERLRTRLDTTISRIRSAARGYSGLFDFVQVNESLLEEVYEHDLSLVDEVDDLARAIEKLPQSGDAPSAAIPGLLKQIDAIDQKLADRQSLLKGLGPDEPR
jgi:hypothetical protein